MGNGSKGRGFRMADDMEIRRGRRDLITVRHPHLTESNSVRRATTKRKRKMSPHLHLVAQPFEQGIDRRGVVPKLVDLHLGKAVFAVRALCNGAPEIPRDFLVGEGEGDGVRVYLS